MVPASDIVHQRFAVASRDGYPLRGDVRHRDGLGDGAPAVVICHGFKGFKDWGFFPEVATELAGCGYVAISFNFSGSGIGPDFFEFTDPERFERATLSGDLDDVRRVLDTAARGVLPGPHPRRLGLLGHSRGGAVSLLAAADDPRVACLVTWAAVSHFDRWDQDTRRLWREHGVIDVVNARTGQVFKLSTDVLDDIEANQKGRLSIERGARELSIPHLIVHGTADESVPVTEGRQIAGWGRGELYEIPAAGHTFGVGHPFRGRSEQLALALGASLDFFQRHLPPAV